MQVDGWMATVAIFLATQIGSLIWVLAGQKGESRVMKGEIKGVKEDISGVQREVEKLGNVLVSMADMRGEINLLNARMLAQGQRLDEEITRSNALRDTLINNRALKD